MNRMQNRLSKRRYMFNASLKWDITDWVNVTGRVRGWTILTRIRSRNIMQVREALLLKVVRKDTMDIQSKMTVQYMPMCWQVLIKTSGMIRFP